MSKQTVENIKKGAEFNKILLEEARKLAMQGYLPVIQGKSYKMNKDGEYVKEVSSGQRYKDVTDPTVALVKLERYLKMNPNRNGDESNTLGIRMANVVNIDFDTMDDYSNFLQLGLIDEYHVATTKVNKTPRGIHYLFITPSGWDTQFKKTTHIDIDGKPSNIDVIFGINAIEHVYPSYVDHPVKGRLVYQRVNENKIAAMPEKLRIYLEQRLNKYDHNGNTDRQVNGTLSQGVAAPTALIERLLVKLSEFGYKDPQFVRMRDAGFDFTYDHSLPDPLDPRVIHDHIDGYVIVDEESNAAIVGTYSDKCKPSAKLLCALEEPNHNEWYDSIEDGDVANEIHMIKYEEKYARPFHDEHPVSGEPVRVSVVMSDMGTGKSFQVLNHIHKHNPKSVLILTPRIMFGQTLQHRLNSGLMDSKDHFKLYNQTQGHIEDPRMICQMESLHRLCTTYDHIYVDEIESCLSCFSSETMKKRVECVTTFTKLMNAAKRIVFCDAHISDRTLGLLSDFGIPKSKIVIERNTFQPNQRSAYRVPYVPSRQTEPKIIELMELKLKEGKNIVFATSSKTFLGDIEKKAAKILKPSEFVCYSADSKDKDKLINVESEWKDKRLVAYNTTISVGIDFNIDHFDLLFVHAVNYKCGPVRDIFQSMHRVRKLKDNILYYSLNPSSDVDNAPNTLKKAREYIRQCNELAWQGRNSTLTNEAPVWLNNLHVHNTMEKGKSKDDYTAVFEHYLTMCGYQKKTTSLNDSDTSSESIIDESETECIPDYDDIPTIDWIDVSTLRQRVFYDPKCTKIDKHTLIKYEYHALGYVGKDAFHLMFSKDGRDCLKNFAREQTQTVEQVLQQEKDYAMFVEAAAVRLEVMLKLVNTLKLEHSTDTDSQFTAKQIMDNMDSLNETLKRLEIVNQSDARRESKRLHAGSIEQKAPYVEAKNRASKAFESYNGTRIVNAKTKSGKGTVTKTIEGKKYQVYQLEGVNLGKCFSKPNMQMLHDEL